MISSQPYYILFSSLILTGFAKLISRSDTSLAISFWKKWSNVCGPYMAVTLLFNQEMMNSFSLYMLIPMINFPKSFKVSSTFLFTSFIVMDQECFITASMGMSAVDISLATIEQALHQADQALLAAKRTGKNKLITYNSIAHAAVLQSNSDGN